MRNVTHHALRILAMISLVLLVGCGPGTPVDAARPTMVLVADDASLPLAESLLNSYESLHPDALLSLQPASRERALAAVDGGEADAALVLHPLDSEGFFHTPVARELLVLVVHPDVAVESLNRRDVRAIFAGQIGRWPGPEDSPPLAVQPVVTEEGSSLRLALDSLLLGGQPVTASALVAADAQQAVALVGETPGAVGLTTGGLLDERVRAVAYDQAAPTLTSASANTYRLVTTVELVTPAEPEGATRAFLDWVLSGQGQDVVRRHMLGIRD